MKYNVLTYLIGEGFSNIFKNKKQAATSFGTMCVIMIFFGICFILVGNFNHFIKQVEAEQGIQAYIVNDATDEEIKDLEDEIKSLEGVNTVEFISKDEALQQMKDRLGEKSYLLDGYEENNIFPASYIVTLTDLNLSSEVQEKINNLDAVKKVTSSDETISALVRIARGIKIGSYIIIIALIAISVFIISNTIKLTVYARRKEISIMKYVGATNSFIRWPFIVEGVLIGIMSGAISLLLVGGIYDIIAERIVNSDFMQVVGMSLLGFSDMLSLIVIVYLILGIGIGALGSIISMRKYLKV
jgi:cell division transport system permease protein